MKKVLMPKRLTAEDGHKGVMIGEFSIADSVPCQNCGEDFDFENNTCLDCGGSGQIDYDIPIPWTTIKEIYAMAVDRFGEVQ